jgi:hypothetical protein
LLDDELMRKNSALECEKKKIGQLMVTFSDLERLGIVCLFVVGL